ncbi:helix-turn-helix transcriptional regulator [Nocardia sp. CY41]|uniref:helix-turn-helix transcriptional regulator n=1 Tax=Nocardia sp. CY41 TaxID=2608686 RepID=UPI00135B1431|nr:LuxR C-terminal-related transcriptional regulator [Nocardia sp. CY41]
MSRSTSDPSGGLLAGIAAASDAVRLFAVTSDRLRRIAPFDAAVWVATDPINGLTAAPVRIENLQQGGCGIYWESEFLADAVNPFRHLTKSPVPAAGLREATGDRPLSSPLYRDFMRPRGFDDELRAVFRVDGRPWGQLSLFRERGRAPFRAEEIAMVGSLSSPMAQRLRAYAQSAEPPRRSSDTPGMLLFDRAGNLASINDEARRFLADMPPGPRAATPSGIDLPLPVWIRSTVGRARETGGNARIRMRAVTGGWLVCHASCLRGADGTAEMTAMTIGPAPVSEIATLVIAAYELTSREREVTELIARGLSTTEIASRLFLSPHTVRDHVKTIFQKVSVASRGELVAKLYTEHYEPLVAPESARRRHP